ncbi:MAG: sulfatase-like hydrolase/transferase [Planctomycetota bacterium]
MKLVIVVALGLLAAALPAQEGRRPNLVVFLVDDLGWADVGCYGHPTRATPEIDRLAREGLRFTDAYSDGPNCAPSRACLMTGRWTPYHGIFTVGTAERGVSRDRRLVPPVNRTALARELVTLPEMLAPAGYVSGAFGKWHLGVGPEAQGFDVNVGGNRAGHPYGGYFVPYKNRSIPDGPRGEYLTDRLTDEALLFVERYRDRPFLLYLAHYAVHTPIEARDEDVARVLEAQPGLDPEAARYAAMIASVDRSLGRVRAKLAELGLEDDTLVVFMSDNGGHGPVASMGPLRGAKGMLYEGGIRVPLVVRWPGRTRAGASNAAPVSGLDLVPTLLDAARVPAAARPPLDGRSLLPLLGGATPGEFLARPLFWHFPAYLEATSPDEGPWRTRPAGAMRRGSLKVIEDFESDTAELYDLSKDPGETRDLATERPEDLRRMRGELLAWRRRTDAPMSRERNPDWVDRAKVEAARARAARIVPRSRRASPEGKPDLVVVVFDDLAVPSVPAEGEDPWSPLRAAGLEFANAYAAAATDAPAQGALLTGRDLGHGLIRGDRAPHHEGPLALPDASVTVAERLAEAGYTTAFLGDWFLGAGDTPGHPCLQGFDRFEGRIHEVGGRRAYRDLDPLEGAPVPPVEALAAFLAGRDADEPVAAFLRLDHDGSADASRRAAADVLRVRAALEAAGRAKTSVLVVTSDQGARPEGADRSRGAGTLRESGLRVPLFVVAPGRVAGAGRSDRLTGHLDLGPTLLALAGGEMPGPHEGRPLGEITGDPRHAVGVEQLYWENHQREQALRRGPWKLFRPHPRAPLELYDVASDPDETRNLARTRPEIAAELLPRLERARTTSREFPLVK